MNQAFDYIKNANKMNDALKKELFGQDRAIASIVNSIKSNLSTQNDIPKATYLFLGPPATGKTYLAELMSKQIERVQNPKV